VGLIFMQSPTFKNFYNTETNHMLSF